MMSKSRRNYSQKTLKLLFAKSGNQCAYPGCSTRLVVDATEQSKGQVIGEICHIYPHGKKGPRSQQHSKPEDIDNPENLILLCPTHHVLIDKQPESHAIENLQKWKRSHEEKIIELIAKEKTLANQEILRELEIFCKLRAFPEFDKKITSENFARKLIAGKYNIGSDEVRSRALAWCARVSSSIGEIKKAKDYLKQAKKLGSGEDAQIADAFLISREKGETAALDMLGNIDTPTSQSARFIIVTHNRDPESALRWFEEVGLSVSDLDSNGKGVLISRHLMCSHWEDAMLAVASLDDADFEEAPTLHQLKACTLLTQAVPDGLRDMVLFDVPFNACSFPLNDTALGMENRRLASYHFSKASEIARLHNFKKESALNEKYALWLELSDPESSDKAKERLEKTLFSPEPSLRYVWLGIQFGIKLNFELIEQEIERQKARIGGITPDGARARFALACAQKTPEDVVSYVERYYTDLSKHFDKKEFLSFQIRMFSEAGMPDRARECLNTLLENGLPDIEKDRLMAVISEASGTNLLVERRKRYEDTKKLEDLKELVDSLQEQENWEELCKYAEELFEKTNTVPVAEQLSYALINANKFSKLLNFLEFHSDFLPKSKNLQLFYAQALYREGKLLQSREELEKINDISDSLGYRLLLVDIEIASGNWSSLFEYVRKELVNKNNRDVNDLMNTARLACHIGSPDAEELLFAVAEKGSDDPQILASVYWLASGAGLDDDPRTTPWLLKAAELSGTSGPIQRTTLADILARKPDWDRRKINVMEKFFSGEIAMFLVSEFLNTSLSNLILFPAFSNLDEADPRRRNVVPAFSGRRQSFIFNSERVAIGLDATSLYLLGFLGILEKVLSVFDSVYIPHSTLAWLLNERKKATFHQPSQIEKAHKIRDLISRRVLEYLEPRATVNSDLSDQIGEELASLIAEAENLSKEENSQAFVVRSSPVYLLSHLMEKEVDLSAHAGVLSSCLEIVKKLHTKGKINNAEAKKACAYLQLQEKQWPQQPEIPDNAILFLDDLSVNYFLHLGLLEKIQRAGFTIKVIPDAFRENDSLIIYEQISDNVTNVIDRIRKIIRSGIKSEKIKIGKQQIAHNLKQREVYAHPGIGVIGLAPDCDIIISDDRFLNQHSNISEQESKAEILTTLDLLDVLVASNSISSEKKLEYLDQLRRAGFLFVPVKEEELLHWLKLAKIEDGQIVESAELKSIRENLLQARMGDWFQLPKEALWFDTTIKAFAQAMKQIWIESAENDVNKAIAISNWVFDLVDVRGWAHRFIDKGKNSVANTGRRAFICSLLMLPPGTPQGVKEAYWKWAEEKFLLPISTQFPELFKQIIDFQKTQIASIVEMQELNVKKPYPKSQLAAFALELTMPPLIRKHLLIQRDFLEEYDLRNKFDATIEIGDTGISFQRSELFEVIRGIFTGQSESIVADIDGHGWKVCTDEKKQKQLQILITNGDRQHSLPNFAILSLDSAVRLHSLEMAASDVNLPANAIAVWRDILLERSLKDEEVESFHNEFRDTPVHIAQLISVEIREGRRSAVSSFVPSSRRYFARLVGEYDESYSIKDYAIQAGKNFMEGLSACQPYDGFLFSLFLSSHSALTAEISVDRLDNKDILRAFEFLVERGDRLSQLGAIEVGLRILPERPEIEAPIVRLIKQIRDDDIDETESGFKVFSALFVFVDGELSRTRLFSDTPPFFRRLASLAQAALIQREIVAAPIKIDSFCEQIMNIGREQFLFQSFADMRLEPRWSPNFSDASQIKADFLGRLIIAGMKYEKNISSSELRDLLLGSSPESIRSLTNPLQSYFSGPLEGGEINVMPEELRKAVETQLKTKEVSPASFIALINSALISGVDQNQAEMATKALKMSNSRLAHIESRSQLLAILYGLATVAAVSREQTLANELRILVRRYRLDTQYALSIDEVLMICLTASASRHDSEDWRDGVGDWLTELAFGDLRDTEGEAFYSHLRCLCHAVPELWISCGRVDAALQALLGK